MFENMKDYMDHRNKLKNDPQYKQDFLQKKEHERIEYWNKLNPFKDINDIPNIPNPLNLFYVNKLLELGAIGIDNLENNKWYYGKCRNADLAKWNQQDNQFNYYRYKFGWYQDTINHFEKDDGYDLFIPIRLATENEVNNLIEKMK